jgi:hypothetical protein
MTEILLALVPLLLLLGCLLFGHYPGCDMIVRFAERIGARRPRRGAKRQARPQAPRSHAASGGLLIAFGLAQRPPPLAL